MSENSNIRPFAFGDRKYVIQSWLYDYQESPAMQFPGLVNDDYFGYEHDNSAMLLERSSKAGAAYMCCEPGQNHLFRGFLIADPFENLPCVHFLKVKKGAQRQGVATALLERFFADFGYTKGQNMVYTYGTKDMKKPWLRQSMKDWSMVYLPWLIGDIKANRDSE